MKAYRLTYIGIVGAIIVLVITFFKYSPGSFKFLCGAAFTITILAISYLYNVAKHRDETEDEFRHDIKSIDQRLNLIGMKVEK